MTTRRNFSPMGDLFHPEDPLEVALHEGCRTATVRFGGRGLARARTSWNKHRDAVKFLSTMILHYPFAEGLARLDDADLLHISYDEIALRFPERFPPQVLEAARWNLANFRR